jgi:hypothetical protein
MQVDRTLDKQNMLITSVDATVAIERSQPNAFVVGANLKQPKYRIDYLKRDCHDWKIAADRIQSDRNFRQNTVKNSF